MRCPPSRIKLWTFHVSTEVRYRDPITRSGQLELRENQLDHSSAGMCYRTRVECVNGIQCEPPSHIKTLDLSRGKREPIGSQTAQ